MLFLKIAWGLVTDPPAAFAEFALPTSWALALGVVALGLALSLKRYAISLALVGGGAVAMLVLAGDTISFGPSPLALPPSTAQPC